jgi:antitoxin (DNA-binding transcriptional repressor) of toxin-antitoxin stability system
MKAVGVKVLKARLSEYLRLVKKGETVFVTERDEVIAELRPARSGAPSQMGDWAALLDNLAEEGKVLLRAEEPGHWDGFSSRFRTNESESDVSRKLLDDLREDR